MAKNMADDPRMGRIADKVAMTANALAVAAAQSTDHVGDAVALTLMAATGALSVTTALICRENKPDPESFLFAGILAGLCSRPMPDGCVAFDYNCGLVVEAMEMFEKATGHKADAFLETAFVGAGRAYVDDGAAEGDRLLAALRASRNSMN